MTKSPYLTLEDLTSPSVHSLHECLDAWTFCAQFESRTGCEATRVADDFIEAHAPRAVFLVGSLPIGMATSRSDIDFIVVIDSRAVLVQRESSPYTNSNISLAFSNENDYLVATTFVTLINGVAVEVQFVIAGAVRQLYGRLRNCEPTLNETEIKTLGRLSTGWLLSQSDGYLTRNGICFPDPLLNVHCSGMHLLAAQESWWRASQALEQSDLVLALHLGRHSVEMAYLAYFASEGYTYLGHKWLAQLGHAIGAAARVRQHPLLKQSLHLLFPSRRSGSREVSDYLHAVCTFTRAVRYQMSDPRSP